MSRPAFVAGPVTQMVAAARPDPAAGQGALSLFPLNQLGAEQQLTLTDLRAIIRFPAGKVLLEFPIGEVSVDPSGGVATVSIDRRFLRISLEPSLRVHAVEPAGSEVTFRVTELSYDFWTQTATCRVSALSADLRGPDFLLPEALTDRIADALTDRIANAIASKLDEAVGATSMRAPGYSLVHDPSPLTTLRKAVTQFTLHQALQELEAADNNLFENGFAAFVRQRWDDALARLVAPETRVLPQELRLTSVAMSFSPIGRIELPNRSGTNALRLIPGSSLRVSAILDVDLGTLQSVLAGHAVPAVAAVAAVAPKLGFQNLLVEGFIHVVYAGEHVATLRKLRITPDGVVDITEFELTRSTEEKVAVDGINLIDLDRAANSLIGAIFAVIALAQEAGGLGAAVELTKQRPELLTPVMSAAVENNRSRLVEPVVRHMAEREIEAALTDEVQKLLHEHVEKRLGMTLETLLGRKPKVTLP
jgi:hypothetical protein